MKLVITGKPDIGKTTLVHIMEREFANKVYARPDALDILKSGAFPEAKSVYGIKCRQRALYHLQVEMENLTDDQAGGRATVCDRGTLDCLALWPGTAEDFFRSVHTSLETELSRYDWVLQINGEDHQTKASLTSEPPLEPLDFWQLHPRFLRIPSKSGFSICYTQVAKVVREILEGKSYEEIHAKLTQVRPHAENPQLNV